VEARGSVIAHLRNVLQMSERRAGTLVAADRKMIRYRSRRPPDIELRSRLRDLANQRRRFGYRRLFILLREQWSRQASTASIGFTARKG
jgi:putative transposase